MKFVLSLCFCFSLSLLSSEFEQTQVELKGCPFSLSLHTVIFSPNSEPTADILFLHGFGDQALNHIPLFSKWQQAGFRIIAFDFPSHGKTTGAPIALTTFRRLGLAAQRIEAQFSADRPLFLAGWSTGGLLAQRMVQSKSFAKLSRPVSGLVLLAPGNYVYTLVGSWGKVTTQTLTQNPNPPYVEEPRPNYPLVQLPFSLFLKLNSWLSRWQPLPQIPIQVFVTGKNDRYVNALRLWRFFEKQKQKQFDNLLEIHRFPESFHGLDVEPSGIAEMVADNSIRFVLKYSNAEP